MTGEQQIEEQNISWFRKYLSEASLLAFLTFGAYLIAYVYDYGYLSYYKISPEVIKISIESFFWIFIAIFLIIIMLFLIIQAIMNFFPYHPALRMRIFKIFYFVALTIIFYKLFGLSIEFYVILGMALLFIFLLFIMPLLLYKDKKTFIDKLIADEEHPTNELHAKVLDKLGPLHYNLLITIIILAGLAFSIGKSQAIKEKNYYVMADNPSVAVIRMYQDILISIPFKADSKTFNGRFIIQKIGGNHKVEFIQKSIGPLKFESP